MNDIKTIIYIVAACFACFFFLDMRHAPVTVNADIEANRTDIIAMSQQIEKSGIRAELGYWERQKNEFDLTHSDNPMQWAADERRKYMEILEQIKKYQRLLNEMGEK